MTVYKENKDTKIVNGHIYRFFYQNSVIIIEAKTKYAYLTVIDNIRFQKYKVSLIFDGNNRFSNVEELVCDFIHYGLNGNSCFEKISYQTICSNTAVGKKMTDSGTDYQTVYSSDPEMAHKMAVTANPYLEIPKD